MAFPLIPAAALSLALLLNRDYDRQSCVRNMAFAGISWAVLNSWPIILFVRIFMMLDVTEQGWPMPFVTFMDVAGFAGASLPPFASVVLLVVSNALFVFLLIDQARREKCWSLLSLSLALFFLLHAAFCARYYKAGERFSYNAFKSALSLSFIAVIFALRFFEERLSRLAGMLRRAEVRILWTSIAATLGRGVRFAVSAVILLTFLALNLSVCRKNMKTILTSSDVMMISSQHVALGAFAVKAGCAVITNFDEAMAQSVATYYSPWMAAYANCVASPGLVGAREGGTFTPGDIYAADPIFEELLQTTDAKPIFENGIYKVFRLEEGSLLLDGCPGMAGRITIEKIGGEYMVLRRFSEKNAALRFLSLRPREVNLRFILYGETPEPFSCEIYAGEKFAGVWESRDGFIDVTLEGVMMQPGANEIKINLGTDPSETKISLTSLKIF
jgi:hypothetical protein